MPIQAVQHIRRMRGGAQSHLMRCADSHHYVVKFQNNPQHTRSWSTTGWARDWQKQLACRFPQLTSLK
jgi:hypothetical protein